MSFDVIPLWMEEHALHQNSDFQKSFNKAYWRVGILRGFKTKGIVSEDEVFSYLMEKSFNSNKLKDIALKIF